MTGNSFDGVPALTGSLSADYSDHLSGDYDWFTRVDYIYTGKIYADLNNTAWIKAANHINLRIGARTSNMSLELFGTNLTNENAYSGALLGVNYVGQTYPQFRIGLAQKRMFGARASYNF